MPNLPPKHKPPRAKNVQRHARAPVSNNRQATRHLNTSSRQWRHLRLIVLMEERFTCKQCGKFGDQVDHIDGRAQEPEDYRRENLQTLCRTCHSAKTMRAINQMMRERKANATGTN